MTQLIVVTRCHNMMVCVLWCHPVTSTHSTVVSSVTGFVCPIKMTNPSPSPNLIFRRKSKLVAFMKLVSNWSSRLFDWLVGYVFVLCRFRDLRFTCNFVQCNIIRSVIFFRQPVAWEELKKALRLFLCL